MIEMKAENYNQLRTKILKEIKTELKSELLHELRTALTGTLMALGKEFFSQELRNVDIPKLLIDRFDSLMNQNMKPIVEEAYLYCNSKHRKKILDVLNRVINLKTSTISEIKENIAKSPITQEDKMKMYLENFPEYTQQIETKVE